jgi:hypothetical protein
LSSCSILLHEPCEVQRVYVRSPPGHSMPKGRGFQTYPRGYSRGPFRPRYRACIATPPVAPDESLPTRFPRQCAWRSTHMRFSSRWDCKKNLCGTGGRRYGSCRHAGRKGVIPHVAVD